MRYISKAACEGVYLTSDGGRHGSIAQLGEHLPYKQGVTGSSPVVPTNQIGPVAQLVRAPACHAGGRGFEPLPGRHLSGKREWDSRAELRAGVAQLAEQLICNQQVAGSSPIASSTLWVKREVHNMGRFPSGQREQTVNLPRHASVVRIHPCPHIPCGNGGIGRRA